jgi:hypothetical protein
MNEKIRSTIEKISALSFNARVIADRLGVKGSAKQVSTSAGVEDVNTLKDQIITLNKEVDALRDLIDDEHDAVFTDEQASTFTAAFEKSLADLPHVVISSVYTAEYLKANPRNIRYLICLTLVNTFTTRNLVPMPLWYTVIANNGSLN